MTRTKFNIWWRQVNETLEDEGRAVILFRLAGQWWAEGLTPAQAVHRQLENLESSQEEPSGEPPCRFEDSPHYRADMIAAGRGRLLR